MVESKEEDEWNQVGIQGPVAAPTTEITLFKVTRCATPSWGKGVWREEKKKQKRTQKR